MPHFATHDGTSLHYRDHGDGPPIVLLASQGRSSAMWQHLMLRLTGRGYRCVALDRRGHGRSDDPDRGFDFDTFADDVNQLLIRLDLRGVTLVGHSVGCAEAVRYLTRHGSGRVSRLVLASTTLPFLAKTADNPDGIDPSVLQSVWDAWHADWPHWIAENTPAFVGAGLPGCTISSEMIASGTRDMEQTSLRALLQCSRAAFGTDFRAELPRLDVPTLLIHGTADASCPLAITSARAAALIRGAELRIYENAPHGLYATHLADLEADILDFMARSPISAESATTARRSGLMSQNAG
jgi:non-heme chloroperoxidase